MTNKANTIQVIYLYLMSAAGIILLVMGLYGFVNFVVKSSAFDEYPVDRYELPYSESYNNYQCSNPNIIDVNTGQITASSTDDCTSLTENQEDANKEYRRTKQIEDVTGSLVYLVAGLVLFGFHWKMTKKINTN